MILGDDAKNAMLQGLANKLNVGANAKLDIYVGVDVAVELIMTNPIELGITAGVMTFKTPPEVLAAVSGIPTSAKLLDSTGAVVATYAASEITLTKDKIYQGGYVGIQSLKVRI
ncbi:hypothetical protein H0262_05435 [Psychrobacter cryohalolentis]|uniref:hypothetical protein n=1 Tax=Psychrobacter sp. D2 TaxID=2759702 RepID=UPI0015E62BB2|nr:hypothetical protein [Psychrobacter sp. D2]MBA2057323.1 hypothetical protein [Psychrobacter sp. D2]